MRDGPCSLVTHVLPPSSYQSRRSISVTWPIHGHVSQFSNRATRRLHGARCDEPPRRWLPRGTGCVRVARARGRDAAAPPLVKVRLLFGAEVQCTGSAIWRTAFLSILQWMCCGTLRPASLQMAGGSAMLMVPLSVHVFLHVVVRSSCSMRSCSARLWFGMSSRPLLGRTRGGPLAWSHTQCELPLAVHGSPAQVSSPGPRYSLRDVSASVPPCGCAAILDGVAAKAVHPSPCLFDGHMVRSTVCPSDSLAAIAATQVTGLSCGARYHGAPMRVRLHGYALWPFGYSVGLLLPSSHLPHHSVDSPALYYLFYPLPSPRTSGPVGRVQAQRSG